MLTDVFDSMAESFRARGYEGQILWGAEHISDHSDGSRVVIQPTTDTYSAKGASVQGPLPTRGFAQRPILTRKAGGRATIWAVAPGQRQPEEQLRANYAMLDQLINMTIVAVHNASAGQFSISGGSPVNDASQMHHGLVYELEFSVDVPVTDLPWASVAITATEPTTFDQGPAEAAITYNLEDPQ